MRFFQDNRRADAEGVTLMELLVASVILSVSMLGAYQASRSALFASRHVERQDRADREARSLFETIGRDLRCAVVAEGRPEMSLTGQSAEAGGERLSFATLSGDVSSAWRPGARPALRRVSYALSGGKLTRAETALSGPGGSASSVLATAAAGLTLRFYRGTNAAQEWNSDRELPAAVEVAVVLDGRSHRALIRLPAGMEAER